MNPQNQHITQKLTEVQSAVTQLINQGMTVTHISIEGALPRINLLHGPRHKSLPISWKVIRPRRTGGRECEMAANMNGCEIRWTEENYS